MTTPPALRRQMEAPPMLFADCPFCLRPLPLDAASGAMDCDDCGLHLELAPDPVAAAPGDARTPVAA